MATTARLRIPETMRQAIQDMAEKRNESMSSLVRQAMLMYTSGEAVFNSNPVEKVKETTVIADPVELEEFKNLANKANISFYEAVRIAISTYMDKQ